MSGPWLGRDTFFTPKGDLEIHVLSTESITHPLDN